ncbi:MAG: hypothetical protein QOI74_1033, partial [Micromonosporaceae bacterium]|nr:hypothetical protein [Micromonosporaceae bacterium]
AGVGRVYPLLDLRTSHFLLVTGAVTVAVGLVGTVTSATRLSARAPRPVVAGLRVVFVAAAVAGFAAANRGRLDRAVPPGDARENVRAQVRYVAAHRRPGDAILVNLSGQYGFGYYWSADRPEFVKGGVQATGWYVRYPPGRRIVIAAGRDPASVAAALARARGLVTGGGRLWLVRSHVNADESRAWREALAGEAVRSVAVGVEPVALITPPAPTRP